MECLRRAARQEGWFATRQDTGRRIERKSPSGVEMET